MYYDFNVFVDNIVRLINNWYDEKYFIFLSISKLKMLQITDIDTQKEKNSLENLPTETILRIASYISSEDKKAYVWQVKNLKK